MKNVKIDSIEKKKKEFKEEYKKYLIFNLCPSILSRIFSFGLGIQSVMSVALKIENSRVFPYFAVAFVADLAISEIKDQKKAELNNKLYLMELENSKTNELDKSIDKKNTYNDEKDYLIGLSENSCDKSKVLSKTKSK